MDEQLNITRINTRLCSKRKFLSASRIGISPVSNAFNCFGGPQNDEVEFITIIILDSLDAVRRSAGEDHEQAVMPENARLCYHVSIIVPSITRSKQKEETTNRGFKWGFCH